MAPRVRVSPDRRRARATTSRWGALLHADAPAAAGRLAVAVWLPRDASPVLTRPVDVAAEHGYPVAPLPAPDDGPFAFGVEATMRAILSQAGWTGVSSTPHTVALHVGGPGCSAEEATHIVMVAGMVGRLVQDAPAAAAADAAADADAAAADADVDVAAVRSLDHDRDGPHHHPTRVVDDVDDVGDAGHDRPRRLAAGVSIGAGRVAHRQQRRHGRPVGGGAGAGRHRGRYRGSGSGRGGGDLRRDSCGRRGASAGGRRGRRGRRRSRPFCGTAGHPARRPA